jgi:two-component system nitrate/nitrite response regulator NarL
MQQALPAMPIGVLVVDDQPAVREGVARLIACAPLALRCVSTAANGTEALSAAARLRPDVVVLDVDLAGEDGLDLIAQLRATSRVVVLSSHGDSATRARARQLGAMAFVEKHEPAAELLGAIVEVATPCSREEEAPGASRTSSHLLRGDSSDVRSRFDF